MNITSYDIAFIFSQLFTLYSIKLFYDIFFKPLKNYTCLYIGSFFLYFLGTSLLHFFVSVPFINLIANIIMLFIITLCCDAPIRKKLIAVTECYLIMFTSEIIVFVLTESAYIDPLKKNEYSNILGFFISRMLILLFVLIISRCANMKSNRKIPYWLFLSSLTVPIITIVIELLFTTTDGVTINLVLISMICLLLINIMVFFLLNSLSRFYEQSLEAAYIEQERTYYKNQCGIMQSATEDMRSFKHDISNHFSVLSNLLKNSNNKKASDYLDELISSEKTSATIYSDTGNIAVDSIINYKLCNAPMNNIDVNTDIIIQNELPIEIMDLSTILTNLLDNSIQALKKINDNRKLDIKMTYTKGVLLIGIRNTYNGIVKYNNGELMTTKENDNEHGYGMKNVNEAVQKYDGICEISHDEHYFESKVLLYANKSV